MSTDSISRRNAIVGGACLATIAGVAGAAMPREAKAADSAPDFQGIVDGLEDDEQKCCTVYEDSSGMLIDTNPDNADGGSFLYSIAGDSAIDKVFEQLGLPQILTGMFGQCSASDGWQTRTRGSYEVSWKYHPDAGLRVFIEWLG